VIWAFRGTLGAFRGTLGAFRGTLGLFVKMLSLPQSYPTRTLIVFTINNINSKLSSTRSITPISVTLNKILFVFLLRQAIVYNFSSFRETVTVNQK